MSHFLDKKMKARDLKLLVLSHTARKWQCWDQNTTVETSPGNTDPILTLKHTHSLTWLTSTLCYQLGPTAKTTDWLQPQKSSSHSSGGRNIQESKIKVLADQVTGEKPLFLVCRWQPSRCVLTGLSLGMHTRIHIHTHAFSHIHMHALTHSCTHTHTHARAHTQARAQTQSTLYPLS